MGELNDAPTTPTATTTIVAKANYTFSPAWIEVPVGSTVTFQFEGVAHAPTFSAILGAPASIGSTTNASVQRAFPSKGIFNYTCSLHSFMTGRITVQ
jgi:plastocyanin